MYNNINYFYRNFEGRINPHTRANYLASPPLCIAYAIAGTVLVDFEKEPLGKCFFGMCICVYYRYSLGMDSSGNPVFLKDIWPTRKELQEVERQYVLPAMFKETYSKVTEGNRNWNSLQASESLLYPWDSKSTYVKSPPFFDSMNLEVSALQSITEAQVLLNLGDSVTTGGYCVINSTNLGYSRKKLSSC